MNIAVNNSAREIIAPTGQQSLNDGRHYAWTSRALMTPTPRSVMRVEKPKHRLSTHCTSADLLINTDVETRRLCLTIVNSSLINSRITITCIAKLFSMPPLHVSGHIYVHM